MLKYLLKNSFSSIFRRKSFALINIVGLSLGITVFFMLFVYVKYENSYDKFLPDSENTYRVELDIYQNGKLQSKKATSTYNIGPMLKREFSHVKEYARAGFEKCLVYKNHVKYNAQELFWTDSTFLKVLKVKMLRGDVTTALAAPYSVVLSDKMAHKYFGDEDAMGKTIFINEHLQFTVKGIFKALPHNSHLNFKLLLSLSTGNVLWPGWGTNNVGWGGYWWLYTYITMTPGTDAAQIESRINKMVKEQMPDNLLAQNFRFDFHLTKVEDIHLTSKLENEFKVNGSKQNTNILFIIAIIIILIAWINFINISSSEVIEKAKDAGIRKLNGASRSHIMIQYLLEVFILNCVSLGFTMVFIKIFITYFEGVSGVPLEAFLLQNSYLYLYLFSVVFVGTILSGIYPAIVLSSFKPHLVLKGSIFEGKSNFALRKVLVVFQMFATIVLIVSAITIYKQINYINSKDLGYNKEQLLIVEAPSNLNMDSTKFAKYLHFKDIILKSPKVKSVTSTAWGMGQQCIGERTYNTINGKNNINIILSENQIDQDFLKTFGIKLLAGKNFEFRPQQINDKALVNLKAVKEMGFQNPKDIVGSVISVSGNHRVQIIGVINDYHQESLKNKVKPMICFYRHPNIFGSYAILLSPGKISNSVDFIKEEWEKQYPNAPFDYKFLDSQLEAMYVAEKRFAKLLVLFTSLAIIIACLGLLGLIIIMTRKMVKEIGVRKVNGATVLEIITMINRQFTKWVVIAFIIAVPLSYYAMSMWLSKFAYKTDLSWWIFAVAGLATLGIALVTVTWQSLFAATRNPVVSLRYE